MPKSHKKTQKHKKRYTKKHRKTMKGGSFSQNELNQLSNVGFTRYQINSLQDLNISFNEIMQKVDRITNQNDGAQSFNSDDLTEQVMTEIFNEHMNHTNNSNHLNMDQSLSSIRNDDNDHVNNYSNMDMDMDQSFSVIGQDENDIHDLDMDDNSFHMSDLDMSQDSMDSGYTTNESQSFGFGGKKYKNKTKKRKKSKNTHKNTKKYNKKANKKSNKKINKKGGMCFGNGVGANKNDINYSVYNTNMLKLFPYKP